MDQVAIAVGIGIGFAVIWALGEWIFRRLTGQLASRLHPAWRWLTLPITAVVNFLLFLALRPLVLDKPPSLLILVGLVIVAALVVTSAMALTAAVLQLLGIRDDD